MKKVYLLSLGCPRNLLDSEVLLAGLEKKGFTIVDKIEEAEIGIVNTCGFIKDAKEESLEAVLHLAELKKEGKIQKIIVAGCLSQRYPAELMSQIKEIDALFGSSDFVHIPEKLEEIVSGKRVRDVNSAPEFLYDHRYKRKLITSSHSVYLKIQEGCSNRCTYCVIPDLKGPRRSRTIGSVVEELKRLKEDHRIKEVLLIGQDTTSFGFDRGDKSELPELLTKVSHVMKDGWVRLLYTHPAHFTDELIEVIAETENICKYIDLPIQHVNDRILTAMNRKVLKKELVDLIGKIRKKIPGCTLRTSVILGFPGETREEFQELAAFLANTRFERLGAFIYSQEEGTPAAKFPGQVPVQEKEKRFDEIMRLQQNISRENNEDLIGKTIKVLVDEVDPLDSTQYIARGQMDAPEVDGVVYVKGEDVIVGEFCTVEITGTTEYDLEGRQV